MIANLRTNCTDIEEPSSTTTQITTIPTEEPSCGDINDVICNLEEQNQILMQQNSEIKLQVEDMSGTINDLVEKNAEMSEKLVELSEENSQIKQMLNEVLEGILELSTRPCRI